MSFISLPHSFGLASADPDAKPGEYKIALMEGGETIPVGFLYVEDTLPDAHAKKLAANLASLLNDKGSMLFFGGETQMYFQPLHQGSMAFNFRPAHDEGGVSKIGAVLTMTQGFEHLLSEAVENKPDLFKLFMRAGCDAERRSEPRTGSDSKPLKPPVAPTPQRPSF